MKQLLASTVLLGALAANLACAQPPSDAAVAPAGAASTAAATAPGTVTRTADIPVSAVDGMWCGSGPLSEFSLRLTQRQQDVEGELVRRGRSRTIEGRIEGNVLRTQTTKVGALVLEHRGDQLKVTDGDGPLALVRGQVFRRSDSGTCAS